jgi:methionyl-tRNA formyltransferase
MESARKRPLSSNFSHVLASQSFWKEQPVSEPFTIALIGQAAFGENVLDALVNDGQTIAGVFCAPDKGPGIEDPIKTAAGKHNIPVFQFQRMRSPEAVKAFRELKVDLGVMAFVTDIVPLEILEAPKRGTIQYHPSLLPKHRGPSSINWPIIQGETKTGLSIFWPDHDLDTGPILMQKEVDIEPDDTLGTVYFKKLFPLGVEAMVESVRLVREGKAPKIEQDHSQATYEGWCKSQEAHIDWSADAAAVYNLVRGADPSPGANSTYKGEPIAFYDACQIDGDGEPGTILKVDDDAIEIALADGALQVKRVRFGGAKVGAAEWAASVDLTPGDRFGD